MGGITIKIQQLRYFIGVAKYLNFSKAARHLFVAQPALSHSIANLEKELGVQLFYRNTKSVKLTEEGKIFLEEATEIIKKFDLALEKINQIGKSRPKKLNIGFLGSAFITYFPKWIPAFRNKYPNINLNLNQLDLVGLHDGLINSDIDIGFTRSLDIKNIPGLCYEKIYDDGISLVMSKDYPLANISTIDFSVIAKEPFIQVDPNISPNWYKKVIQVCNNRGFTPNIAHSPHNIDAVYTLLDAKLGISMLPNSAKNYNYPNLRFIKIEGEDTWIDAIVVWKKNNYNPVIPFFLKEIGVEVSKLKNKKKRPFK